MKLLKILIIFCIFVMFSCKTNKNNVDLSIMSTPFEWQNATIYFMLTDRFNNGDKSNDFVHPTNSKPAPYRGFMGGDVKGITQKIEEGYFNDLGVNAIWMTPLVQNIDGSVDEGTGLSFGFHGYWTKDWTTFDKRVGTKEDIKKMVDAAHKKGIRVLMDVVINHTGPVTNMDPQWPDEWVKTKPKCTYTSYESTTNCTLVDNLPDLRTESNQEVSLPQILIDKWKSEGRYDIEVAELNAFFKRTGYPKLGYYYLIKWLTDLITDFGIDGYRVDTAKHLEEEVWKALKLEADYAFATWKKNNPTKVLDDNPFFMMGEVYFYSAGGGKLYDFGDKKVDYFANGFNSLINFDFKSDANKSYDEIFTKYDALVNGPFKDVTFLNYISSHDDGGPYDLKRERPIEAGTKLLLCQGGAQIYYGDELARSLTVEAKGDATLRSFMNWDDMNTLKGNEILVHWQKLGKFRAKHPSIASGKHNKVADSPYIFSRIKENDRVVCALDTKIGLKEISVGNVFKDGDSLIDEYSGQKVKVKNNKIIINTPYKFVLLNYE